MYNLRSVKYWQHEYNECMKCGQFGPNWRVQSSTLGNKIRKINMDHSRNNHTKEFEHCLWEMTDWSLKFFSQRKDRSVVLGPSHSSIEDGYGEYGWKQVKLGI